MTEACVFCRGVIALFMDSVSFKLAGATNLGSWLCALESRRGNGSFQGVFLKMSLKSPSYLPRTRRPAILQFTDLALSGLNPKLTFFWGCMVPYPGDDISGDAPTRRHDCAHLVLDPNPWLSSPNPGPIKLFIQPRINDTEARPILFKTPSITCIDRESTPPIPCSFQAVSSGLDLSPPSAPSPVDTPGARVCPTLRLHQLLPASKAPSFAPATSSAIGR